MKDHLFVERCDPFPHADAADPIKGQGAAFRVFNYSGGHASQNLRPIHRHPQEVNAALNAIPYVLDVALASGGEGGFLQHTADLIPDEVHHLFRDGDNGNAFGFFGHAGTTAFLSICGGCSEVP